MAVTEDDPPMEAMRATVSTVRIARRAISLMVDSLEPDDVALSDALDLWKAFDGVERLAANAKTLLAARSKPRVYGSGSGHVPRRIIWPR